MSSDTNGIRNSLDNITDDAQSLISATADATEEKVVQARNRLAGAMAAAKDAAYVAKQKVVDGAKATDKVIRDNPYQALGVAFAVGAVVGFLLSRRDRE